MNNNKKVCHLTSAHADGDIRIFHKECSSLAEAGYDVTLIVPNTEERIENGVRIVSFQFVPSSRINRFRKSVDMVYKKALEIDADLYHFHDPELLRVGNKLKKMGKKVIYDAHEDLPRQILSKPWIKPFIRKRISRTIEKYEDKVSSRLDAVITATPYIRDRFLKINSNTIDINNFPLTSEINYTKSNSEKKNQVCYIGGISEIRGIFELTESIDLLDNITLQLAGKFSGSEFEKRTKASKGWQKVNELGFISREESLELKSCSLAGMVTFHAEQNHINAQPNKIFEYMASELPVIGSNFPLWKEIIEGFECGICVDPLNPQEIADAIKYIADHPEEAKKMGENGKKAVSEKLNWDHEKQKLIALYEKILK